MKHPRRWLCLATGLAACSPVAPSPSLPGVPAPGPASPQADTAGELPPVGYGSLRQDEFSVELLSGDLHVKVTPLDERVIRLAAPDTYERLQALRRSREADAAAESRTNGPALFLVSFFSRQPNVEYRPEEVVISHRGRLQRPGAILPLTTGWGRQLLQPQQTQSAIYAFPPPVDFQLPLSIRYGARQSDEWHRTVLPRLEEERTRVAARAGGRR